MIKSIKIGRRKVGPGEPTFIVAEMSSNHGQDFKKAVSIIKAAAKAGADAIKLQTFTPDTITLNSNKKWFRVGGKNNPESWKGQTFYDLYKKAHMPWKWFPRLKKIAENLGLVFFSTPFDSTAVDFLEKLSVPCYKIAAYESIDVPLLRRVAKTKKPVIVSVGFSTFKEVKLTIQTLKKAGAKEIILLQCTTSYDSKARFQKTNLKTMSDIRERLGVLTGFSDNMGGVEAPILAAALGAVLIEKHLVLKHGKVLDDRFSLDPKEFGEMVKKIRQNEAMIGKVTYGPQTPEENYNRNFRRSLFAAAHIRKGEKFSSKNVRSVRPGYGLPPYLYDAIIGHKAKKDISFATPLSWELID